MANHLPPNIKSVFVGGELMREVGMERCVKCLNYCIDEYCKECIRNLTYGDYYEPIKKEEVISCQKREK